MSRALRIGLLGLVVTSQIARAEGSDAVGTNQALLEETVLLVDILDSATETIVFTGSGEVDATAPDGTPWGTYGSGDPIVLAGGLDGAWTLELSEDQDGEWDVSVPGALGGRLHSTLWRFNAGGFGESEALYGSFYVLIPTSAVTDAVVDLRFDGLAGFEYTVQANAIGVDGPNAGRSVPKSSNTVAPLYALYIGVPERAVYGTPAPVITGAGFVGDDPDCNAIAPGVTAGVIAFDSSSDGVAHVVCDTNLDGTFDESGTDYVRVEAVAVGANEIAFDGYDNGTPLPNGSYDCVVTLGVGEVHFVADDIETVYQGLRMFEVDAAGAFRGLPMAWDDSAVQGASELLPNGEESPVSSGATYLDSGDADDPPLANVNARAWGDFSSASKGNSGYLDTWTRPFVATSTAFVIELLDAVQDQDGDTLTDLAERCDVGSSPVLPDTDGDTLLDGQEVSLGSDPLDVDTDDGGVDDGVEFGLGADLTYPGDDDPDGDGLDNDAEAGTATDPNVADTDGDTLNDGVEVTLGVDPLNPDTDGDTLDDGLEVGLGSNPLDPDTDAGGVDDGAEFALGSDLTDPGDDDPDADGLDNDAEAAIGSDPLDPDTDGDTLLDGQEVTIGSDPLDADTDDGGVDDGTEFTLGSDLAYWGDDDPDGDTLDNDAETALGSDPNNPDTDGDGIADGDEPDADSDSDGIIDILDPIFDVTTPPTDTGTEPPDDELKGTFTGSGLGCSTGAGGASASAWVLALLFRRRTPRC